MKLILITLFGLFFIFFFKIVFVISTSSVISITQGALFTRTSFAKIKRILEYINLKPGQIVYDIGCGDGRFLRAVVKKYKVKAIGYEINPWAYFLAKIYCLAYPEIKIYFANFWRKNLSDADLVFCYLFPDVMKKLRKKLEVELKPDTWVVSCNFPIPGWEPKKVIYEGDPIYIYRI
ncbi:MAG: class I SAM-dependent methyltransferase [Candidatus Desulfofervidus auxilii]|nr:class I SAM-dependent methyltransferase [Candidatus Desulfofervidus auxilii]